MAFLGLVGDWGQHVAFAVVKVSPGLSGWGPWVDGHDFDQDLRASTEMLAVSGGASCTLGLPGSCDSGLPGVPLPEFSEVILSRELQSLKKKQRDWRMRERDWG